MEIEDRIDRLEAQSDAYGLVLMQLLATAIPHREWRSGVREACCNAVEAMYADKVSTHGDLQIQRVVHEIEELFRAASGAVPATRPE